MRLVCLPHAGGSAAIYRPWKAALAGVASVDSPELPGRGTRQSAPFPAGIVALAEDLAAPLAERSVPLVLYGHSMGALLAFETARALARHGVTVAGLVLSGRAAPHLPFPSLDRHQMSDAQLIAELRRIGGTSDAVLAQPDLLAVMLPALKADFRMVDTYAFAPGPKLDCPAVILGGADDLATPEPSLHAWRELVGGPLAVEIWPGGHFFVREEEARLLALLKRQLPAWRAARAGV
ncbi:alpha/beta fold hydrolase [Xanthobacter sp. KR7-65]|uniref:thioesterase II family protein n=1 Tax=Xanthobacter sp. KR7-65 TaxID=3156612 RepID=UPI0032B3F891